MTSFCGQFKTFSKVVICLMMIPGRHRMLPYALDRAIMFPTDVHPRFGETGDKSNGDDTNKAVLPTTPDGDDLDLDESAGPTDTTNRRPESTSEKHSNGQ
jgi:hypothetical protein